MRDEGGDGMRAGGGNKGEGKGEEGPRLKDLNACVIFFKVKWKCLAEIKESLILEKGFSFSNWFEI